MAVNMHSNTHINGLLFSSSAERINDRTSLILFDQQPLKLKDSFTVDFELSIWDVKQFGYIFRVINESKQEINFSFVNFYGNDKIYLDFHSPITHKSVLLPITLQDIDEKRWLPISIRFDLVADRAELKWKNQLYNCESIGLKNPSHIKLAFGLFGLNLDVPRMAIRNIAVSSENRKPINILLDEVAGENVRDMRGYVKGKVQNPNWLANRYYFWQEKLKLSSDSMTRIAYDERNNRVIIADKKAIHNYSMRYDIREEVLIEGYPGTLPPGEAIYDNKNGLLYAYNTDKAVEGRPSMAIIDLKNRTVNYKNGVIGNRLHHHNSFIGMDNGLFIFGGYGNHSYSNNIYRYDAVNDRWEIVNLSGDAIFPRYFSATGQHYASSQILIMGGIGNESGKQEHGGVHLYDLYSVDLNTKQRSKIWELKEDFDGGFVPCGNLILDENRDYFYTLCYPQHQVNSVMQLYRFSLKDGSYQIVSDSIHVNAEQLETTVFLFYNKLMHEFYTVIRENSNDGRTSVRIYSLLSNPVTLAELMAGKRKPGFWFLILVPVLMLLAGAAFVIFRKRKKQEPELTESPDVVEIPEREPEDQYHIREVEKKNAVMVFGDFTVFDRNGRDISYRFSSKLRSLFALILFYSIDDERISTEKLTADLWPDKDPDSAKNTRGVTINRLRGILADISGITLYHQNSKWYFAFDEEFYCDYIEYRNIAEKLKDPEADRNENMAWLLEILKRGTLYPGLQENWIDAHKHTFENEIYKILWEHMIRLNEQKRFARLVEFADVYFMNDPLNEDVLKLAVTALQKSGKRDQALILYNKFVTTYKKSMGEDPDLSLQI